MKKFFCVISIIFSLMNVCCGCSSSIENEDTNSIKTIQDINAIIEQSKKNWIGENNDYISFISDVDSLTLVETTHLNIISNSAALDINSNTISKYQTCNDIILFNDLYTSNDFDTQYSVTAEGIYDENTGIYTIKSDDEEIVNYYSYNLAKNDLNALFETLLIGQIFKMPDKLEKYSYTENDTFYLIEYDGPYIESNIELAALNSYIDTNTLNEVNCYVIYKINKETQLLESREIQLSGKLFDENNIEYSLDGTYSLLEIKDIGSTTFE